MKKIANIFLLGVSTIIYAQNVGINTPEGQTPQQTLDIEGTLAISDTTIPADQTFSKYLAWKPSEEGATPTDKNNGQIIYAKDTSQEKIAKFYRYKFRISNPSEDFIDGANLGFDTDKYTLLLMQYHLEDHLGHPVYTAVLRTDGVNAYPLFSQPGTGSNNSGRGNLDEYRNIDFRTETYEAHTANGKIGTASPIVMVYPKNGKWHLYADYPSTIPITFNWKNYNSRIIQSLDTNSKFTWNIRMLVIKNEYIINEDEIEISTSGNYTHPELGK